jgi:WD40 repeat protein
LDNRWTATGSRDRQVILREASSGRERRRLAGHKGPILALAFSPDGQHLASGGEDAVARIWKLDSGRCIATLTNHRAPVISLAFSPDGQLLASGGSSPDGQARLWDTRHWCQLHAFQVSVNGPTGLAFSPDSRRLATAGGGRNLASNWERDSRIRLWDVVLGGELLSFSAHTNAVYGVAFSPDGLQLATTSGDHTVRLWTAFPWRSDDYPGAPMDALAVRVEDFKRHTWQTRRQPASDPTRRVLYETLGFFHVPAAGSKTNAVSRIPDREPRTTPAQLDLDACYNVALDEPWQPLDGVQDAGRSLASLAPGLHEVDGTLFDVRGIVQLRRNSADCELFPERTVIAAGQKFTRLHVLQGTRWMVRQELPVAAFILHYSDGTQAELPILYGIHVRDEDRVRGRRVDTTAATAPQPESTDSAPRLHKTTLLNPHPERQVNRIEYVSMLTQSAPFLVALTVE